jgi:S1-C subfamily serine protease
MLATLVLFAAAGAATPAQHQQAVTALYQVLVSYHAFGTFVGVAHEGAPAPTAEHTDGTLTVGSAFAVSRDGWLMTAGHVVDPADKLDDLCERLGKGWPGLVLLRYATLTMLVEDIAGARYGIVADIGPEPEGENLCMPGTRYTITYNGTMTARIKALDDVADLALIEIDAAPVSALELAPKQPPRWTELFAVGYTDPGQRTVYSGAVARRCEETDNGCVLLSDGSNVCSTVRVMRTTAPVMEGMSGSPQVVAGRAVGITTMRSLSSPVGFAVPSTYAIAWYRHVRWPGKHPRPTTVCTPEP